MTSYGFTMIVKGIPEEYKGIQIIEHRMLSYIDPNLSDDQIKHELAYAIFTDFAFSKPLTLKGILDDCIKYKIIPIINLCITEGTWKDHARLSPVQCARIGGILRDYLKSRGFVKGSAYETCFNEPNTDGGLSTSEACQYWNELHDKVGNDFDVIYGNDEMGNLDWNYLGKNCRAKVMGTHFLSCMGSWTDPKKNWHRIENAKTTANLYKKKLICVEGGSWFKDFCKEGHQINLDIMAECKKYDIDCLIVLPDVNEETKKEWKLLGYRVFNNDFTKQVGGCSDKFNEFINYIKLNGTIPNFEKEEDMKLEKYYYKGKVSFPNDKGKYGHRFLRACFRLFDSNIFDETLDIKLRQYQVDNNLLVDGIVGPETFGNMIKEEDFYKHYCWVHSLWARGLQWII